MKTTNPYYRIGLKLEICDKSISLDIRGGRPGGRPRKLGREGLSLVLVMADSGGEETAAPSRRDQVVLLRVGPENMPRLPAPGTEGQVIKMCEELFSASLMRQECN